MLARTVGRMLAAVLFALLLLAPGTARAAETGLSANIDGGDPARPVLRLTNDTSEACQVVASPVGTTAITEASQGGKLIEPKFTETSFAESLELLLANKLQTLEPGQSVDIPLRVFPLDDGYTLETISWSPDAGAFGMAYALQVDQPLDLTLTYSVPIEIKEGAPACPLTYASTIGGSGPGRFIALLAGGAVAVLLLAAVIIWLLKNKRHRRKAVAAVFVLAAGFLLWRAAPAQAEFEVPESLSEHFAACAETLNANRDITGPVLDALNNPDIRVELVHTTDGTDDTTRYADDYFRIYWDPETPYTYFGTGGAADPCTTLYHEMYHAYDMLQGTFSRDPCGSSSIETKEVMATRAQNELRVRLGFPPRSHYGDKPLPTGDCSDPSTSAPTAPEPCTGEGCGESNGDPHMRSFDDLRFDFQAVGEFVLARDKAGDMEVQTRQRAWPGTRSVAVNSAAALRVGSDRLELRIQDRKTVLFVNGQERELKDFDLQDGAVSVFGNKVTRVVWKDGSAATIRAIGSFGLHVVLDPSAERKGKLEGVLGNFDGNKENDLRIGGTDKTIKPDFEALYPEFADSWRIKQDQSLFTYQPGQDTETFTDRSFPEKNVTAQNVPNRATAEQLCRQLGVTDNDVLADCIIDVALTGRPEFARAAANGQIITSGTDYGGQYWTITVEKPEETAHVTFQGKIGQKVFLDVTNTTFADQCGILDLIAPDGRQIASGCILNGRGHIDGTVLPSDGTYRIVIDPSGERTGTARLQLITIKDQKSSITPDGPAMTARIPRPGVVTDFTFAGQAGQRIFVDVSSTTLPNQCGNLRLLGPTGSPIGTGCLINGHGFIDTKELAANGTYTVRLDPGPHDTGQARIRVVQAENIEVSTSIGAPVQTIKFDKQGSSAAIKFNGNAGQRVFLELSDATLTNQCGGIVLNAPDGTRVASGCIINKRGTFDEDGVVLPTTGSYTLFIDPSDRNTGKVAIRIR